MSLLRKMSHKKLIGMISLVAIATAIPLTVYIAQKQQEIRQRASELSSTAPVSSGSIDLSGIDINLNAGGSINYLELNGRNMVDTNDCGRLIQLALIEYQDNGRQHQVPALCILNGYYTVNPTQGCDGCGHSSPIIEGNSPAYIKVQPVNWVRNGELADFHIEQRIEQINANPRTYRVRYNIIHLGSDAHYMGHEAPAIFLVNPYNTLVTYNGIGPWQNDSAVTTTSPSGRYEFQTNEHWASIIDPLTQQGLTIVDPDNRYWSFWKSANSAPNSNFVTMGKTFVYRGPSTYSFAVYFVLGTWQQGRTAAYQIIQDREAGSQVNFYDYPHTTPNGSVHQTTTKDNGSWNILNRVVDYQVYNPLQISGIRQWWDNETEPNNWITVSPPSFMARGWMALRNTAPAGNYRLNVKIKTATNEESSVFASDIIQLIGTPTPVAVEEDVNADNCVSRRDYEEWLYAFFHNGIPQNPLYTPDINGDSRVNLEDFNPRQQTMRSGANLCAQTP